MRDQRAIETFCTTSPIFIGTRSLKASQCGRPHFDLLNVQEADDEPATNTIKMYHCLVSRCEKSTMTWLSAGSLPGNCLKTL